MVVIPEPNLTPMPVRQVIETPDGELEWFEHGHSGTRALIRTRAKLATREITVAELERRLAEAEGVGPFDG